MIAPRDRVAVHARDHGLGAIEDDVAELPVQRFQPAVLFPLDVAASAERAFAFAGENDHADRAVRSGAAKGLFEFLDRQPADGVQLCGAVDGDGPDRASVRNDDIFERHALKLSCSAAPAAARRGSIRCQKTYLLE